LREGAGGTGGTSTDRGRGIRTAVDFVAPSPSPNPLPQGEGEDFSPAWPPYLMRMGTGPAMTVKAQ
jgi:hypothetical protein